MKTRARFVRYGLHTITVQYMELIAVYFLFFDTQGFCRALRPGLVFCPKRRQGGNVVGFPRSICFPRSVASIGMIIEGEDSRREG